MTVNSNSKVGYTMRFACADRFFSISSADKAKNFIKLIAESDSVVYSYSTGEKFTMSTSDKTAAIFSNVISSRSLISVSVSRTLSVDINTTQNIHVTSFPRLSIEQITELLNLAYEPISNEAWDTHIGKFNPIAYSEL